MDCKHPYIFVYQTICEANGKSYVGIHATSDIDDGYIGCGIKKQYDSYKKTLLFHKAVRKHGYASFRRYILSFYNTYEEALEEERFIVNKKWVKSDDNYNVAIGGNGGAMYGLDEEVKREMYRKIAEKAKGRKVSEKCIVSIKKRLTGVPLTEQHKKSLSENHARYWLGKSRSEELKKKLSDDRKGVKLSENHKKKLSASRTGKPSNNRKKILQYSINGDFIKEYTSLKEASLSLGCVRTAISNNLSGLSKICNGFIFKYKIN